MQTIHQTVRNLLSAPQCSEHFAVSAFLVPGGSVTIQTGYNLEREWCVPSFHLVPQSQ